jgi:hypothetical protein
MPLGGWSERSKTKASVEAFALTVSIVASSFPLQAAASAPGSRHKLGQCLGAGRTAFLRSEEEESIMPLVQLVMVLIVIGVLLWLVNSFIPMAGSIKSLLNAVVVIATVVWLLNATGLLHSLSRIRIGT